MVRPLAGLALLAAAAFAWPAPGDDAATKLKSTKVAERVAAVDTIRHDGGESAEKLLLGALGDKDWEVVEHAVAALAERGTAAGSLDALSKLTVDGPVRRVRLAAARSLAKLDPKAAAAQLTKAVKGESAVRACEGLAAIAESSGEAARAGIEAGLASKDAGARAAAAAGIHAFEPEVRVKQLVSCLKDSDLTVGAAALDSARLHPDPILQPTLLAALSGHDLHDVLERRVDSAIVALFTTTKAKKDDSLAAVTKTFLESARDAKADPAQTRFARLLGLLGAKPPVDETKKGAAVNEAERLLAVDVALQYLGPAITGGSEGGVAAAIHSLSRIANEDAIRMITDAIKSSPSWRVRSLALRCYVQLRTLNEPGAGELVKQCLHDKELDVREDAAVALGRPGLAGAVEALAPLVKDPEWEVAVAAAVSLGKTQDVAALKVLQPLLASKDWKIKCAAIVGLGHLKNKSAVPLLVDALGSKSATEKLCAYEFLRRMTSEKMAAKESGWKSWWGKNEQAYKFPDPEEIARQKKYGYAPTNYGVYEDLDVLVFQSRGDHIEKLLDQLKIGHRKTQLGAVVEAGVAPLGVYVINCTGECQPEDLEQAKWFVHVGGYLFSSCWAVTYHSQEVRPGFVKGIDLKTVIDLVAAEPCCESPYLTGVFDGVTRPKYVLEGPHLIEVIDHERVEVLIDSPECATRHQCGNLAAWWTVGHGLILDSVNHFDLQGFDRAPQMKEAVERMAYAVDTMGLSFADLREVPKGAWSSQNKAAEEVRDLSAFRFITNFVRAKRRSGS